MFNLEKSERLIIVILTASLLLGLGVLAYKKLHPSTNIQISGFAAKADDGLYVRQRININEANAEVIMRLQGVGKALAERIVEYRTRAGRFTSIEDIKNVKGIGPALFGRIKDEISVE